MEEKLIEAGPLGILVLVVIVFLYYLKHRDIAWQQFTKDMRAEDNKKLEALVAQVKELAGELVALREDFNEHNVWERESIAQMQSRIASQDRKTQPRR